MQFLAVAPVVGNRRLTPKIDAWGLAVCAPSDLLREASIGRQLPPLRVFDTPNITVTVKKSLLARGPGRTTATVISNALQVFSEFTRWQAGHACLTDSECD